MMGIGTLCFGLAAFLSFLIAIYEPIYASSTDFPIIVFIAGLSYLFASIFLISKILPQENGPGRLYILLLANIGAIALVILITLISIQNILPPFFIQGEGSTPLRQLILVADAFLFLISGLLIYYQYMKSKNLLLYWFALGLLLIFLVLVGNLFVTAVGTPINWVLRITQLLGGIYLFIAALVILKEAKFHQISSGEALVRFFTTSKSNINILLNNVTDSIIISDYNFNIIGWNQTAENIYGWNFEEALGKPAMDFLQTRYPPELVQPDITSDLFQKNGWRGEIIQKNKDGKDIHILSSISPLKDENNILTGVLAINLEMTRQKKDQMELDHYRENLENLVKARTLELENAYDLIKASEKHYLTLFNSIDEGFCTVEVIFDNNKPIDYRFLEINPAFAKQTGMEDAEGKLMRDLAPDHEEYWFEIYGKIALTGKPMRFVNQAKALNRWYDVYAFRIGNPQSRKVAILFNDITKFKKLEKELREYQDTLEEEVKNRTEALTNSNKELEQFAYITSHDLREPLRIITSFLQLLERRYKDQLDQDANEFIGFAVDGENV
jgi:PAS domain S-box-containing protein